jgi:hypothetical protein
MECSTHRISISRSILIKINISGMVNGIVGYSIEFYGVIMMLDWFFKKYNEAVAS